MSLRTYLGLLHWTFLHKMHCNTKTQCARGVTETTTVTIAGRSHDIRNGPVDRRQAAKLLAGQARFIVQDISSIGTVEHFS
jgi:hypothetical protein